MRAVSNLIFLCSQAYELSTLTGTQVMLLVASETGHVYTFATRKLQPMITSEAGQALSQTCLNSPDPSATAPGAGDQRMSATGFEETELCYNINEDEQKVRQMMYGVGVGGAAGHHQYHQPYPAAMSPHHPHAGWHVPPPPPTPHPQHVAHGSQPSPSHVSHVPLGHAPLPPASPMPPHSPLLSPPPGQMLSGMGGHGSLPSVCR